MLAALNLMLALYHPTMLLLCYCKYCILLGLSLNWSPLNTCVIGGLRKLIILILIFSPTTVNLLVQDVTWLLIFFVMLSDELCMI